MNEPEIDYDSEINSVAYRDVLLNTILGLVMIIGIVALLIQVKKAVEQAAAEPPGNMIVHAVWPQGDTDVDLWVDGPGELVPVGYSNKGGLLWNLLRDDLGAQPDAGDLNYEDSFTRGVVGGDYTINVHCFRCPQLPQEVKVVVEINSGEPGKSSLKPLVNTTVKLVTDGQERTAIRFKLTDKGEIVPGSMNSVFKPLRSAKK
ncbi:MULTISPECIES: hypothetical protein [Mesorhizobium]|uniref:hypothetical protein n=2 Tax=Phyllobacteriaceae TaxID=69277 RepID=UPI0007A93A3E|nr:MULTISPECIES: hypothetical protein [Mesorhizobium]AMX93718.1 hypothetical protein A4R28_11700 [Mesorhizobium ciceri]MDF3208416.1 hypothetical protein [Mesorhizobium sp. LMG15046]MDF3229013.1 hypothetical protein [Mesorhizobium sp. DSM 30133]RUU22129.1 hypothetical protein EOC84_03190 [Mesorhizobium sp. Primo-B]RUU37961.1 hypothetical protein EOC83_17025 [Mesorhizobium sp. Primo-A]